MYFSSQIENQLIDGNLVLFIGSGASKEASNSKGEHPPLGHELGNKICDRFLNGKFKDRPLTQISEYAINETDLLTFQEYLKEIFETFEPTDSHKALTELRWKGIVTTNYDRLIEKAYEQVHNPLQIPIPFIEDTDRVESKMKSDKDIKLLKLHGCISRISNVKCPLIISTDQYIEYTKERRNIFSQLLDWAYERTILFIGYSLLDLNFRNLLRQLDTQTSEGIRPRYYAIMPNFEDVESRFWESKKITLMKGTFSDFISKTNEILPKDYRQILKVVQPASKHPIYEKFIKSDTTLSPSCYEFLQKDVDYVKSINSTRIIHAKDFYKGYNDEWSGIEQSLDATRLAVDDILMKRFIIDETEHEGKIELIVMLGHAGSGKTIIMRRIAWNAAKDLNFLCLYLKDGGQIDTYSIQEIINLTGERVFLFVDNISKRIREIKHLINNIGVEGQKLTIVGCERLNEWNMYCEELLPIVTSKYQVKYLEPCEIDFLINLLEEHKSLGTLSDKSREECKIAFAERAGRQLLVALHEATLGKKYEDIIVDEYNNITPKPAQLIYLSICVLNRLDVPVRAGIISRIHGIPFEEFQNKFFKPLEHVIFTKFNSYINDYEYRARHQHIAQIVFENILRNKEDRFNEYLRCLKELNVSYSSDDKAFRQMIRAAELLSLFSDTEQVKHIFNEAYDVVGEDPYLYHQMAIYEMKRSGGNLKKCQSLLVKALELSPDNDIIKHSFAEYNLLMVDKVDTELEKEKLRNQTISIANSLIKSTFGANYAYHTLIKVGLKKIEDYKSNGFTITSKELEETIKEIQKNLTEGLQRYPGNSYLLSAESELAEHLSNSEKVFSSLEKAFSANMRNTYIAGRLSKMYVLKGELKQAKDILEKALDANNNDSKLHYYYSKLLIETEYSDSDAIIYHLQRSFSTGDRNYDARLLYVRQLFIINKMNDEYRSVYSELSKSKVSFDERTKRLYPLKVKFTGQINRIGSTYCLIIREGIGDTIYSRREDIAEEVFLRLTNNTRVYFKIAFNFRGPIAIDVEIINF